MVLFSVSNNGALRDILLCSWIVLTMVMGKYSVTIKHPFSSNVVSPFMILADFIMINVHHCGHHGIDILSELTNRNK